MEPWTSDSSILVRFEHIFAISEDPNLSKNVQFNLKEVFHNFDISTIRETTLAANQWLNESRRFEFKEEIIQKYTKTERANNNDTFNVTLSPMQIRTFAIWLKKKQ